MRNSLPDTLPVVNYFWSFAFGRLLFVNYFWSIFSAAIIPEDSSWQDRSDTFVEKYIYNDNVVHRNTEDCSQDDKIVDRRHCRSVDPFVDRLRSCKAKHHLNVSYAEAGLDPQSVDILTGSDSIDTGNSSHDAPPLPAEPAQEALA